MEKRENRGSRHFLRGRVYSGTTQYRIAASLLGVLVVFQPATSLAYVGPGAGLTMIGSAIALVVVVLVAAAGLIIWPLRAVRRRKQRKLESQRIG